MYERALELLKEINSLGFDSYIVGGYPRDKYRGKKNTDIDICTSMKPNKIKQNFKIIVDYEKMGSFVILYKNYPFQITTFRKEGKYTDFRHPSEIEFVDFLEEDLKRRDFIMNTLCINQNGEYVDYMGAREDINKKRIRTVGNSLEKIKEDPLRIVRAIRFMLEFDFTLEENLERAIEENLDLLKKISKFKIEEEIKKISSIKKQERTRALLKI